MAVVRSPVAWLECDRFFALAIASGGRSRFWGAIAFFCGAIAVLGAIAFCMGDRFFVGERF